MDLNDEKNAHPAPPPPYSASGPPPAFGPSPSLGPHPVLGPPPASMAMSMSIGVVTAPTVVHTNTAVVGVVPMVVGQQMGSKPGPFTCKSCHADIVTRVEQKTTLKTHFFAAILCGLGCWCCVCLPYCVDSCRNTDHYCPNCNAYIGSYTIY